MVSGGVSLPGVACFGGDLLGGGGVEAEQGCDERWRGLEDEFAECSAAAGGVGDAEVLESLSDAVGLDGESGDLFQLKCRIFGV